jgi:hypothetical protein
MKRQLLLILLLLTSVIHSQDCDPSKVSKQTNGDLVKLYGGRIRSGGFGSNDKSVYSLYIAQVEDGKKGTSIVALLYEPVETKKDYDYAVNNFLNEINLEKSVLVLELNGEKIKIPATECKQKPAKLLGSIAGYNVTFEGDISKSDIEKLQKNDLQRFRLVIGGHPYERYFKKPTKRTSKLKKAFNCVNMENVFELKKKNANEMDLTEVSKSDYSKTINGKWALQGSSGKVVEFKDGKVTYSKMGVNESEGSYKVVGNRIIITTGDGNSISEISMFLKDMLILKEKGEEKTYERIE